MVLPMVKFSTRAPDLSFVSMTTPSTYPLVRLHLTTSVAVGFAPPVVAFNLHGDVSQDCGILAPPHSLHHVRIDCPSILPGDDYKVETVMDLLRTPGSRLLSYFLAAVFPSLTMSGRRVSL